MFLEAGSFVSSEALCAQVSREAKAHHQHETSASDMALSLELSRKCSPGIRQESHHPNVEGHEVGDLPKGLVVRSHSAPHRSQGPSEGLPPYKCQEVRQPPRKVRSMRDLRPPNEMGPTSRTLGTQALTGIIAVLTLVIDQHGGFSPQVQSQAQTFDQSIGSLGLLNDYKLPAEALQHRRFAADDRGLCVDGTTRHLRGTDEQLRAPFIPHDARPGTRHRSPPGSPSPGTSNAAELPGR